EEIFEGLRREGQWQPGLLAVAQLDKPVVGFPRSAVKDLAVIDSLAVGVIASEDSQQPFAVAALRFAPWPTNLRLPCPIVGCLALDHWSPFFVAFFDAFFAGPLLPHRFLGSHWRKSATRSLGINHRVSFPSV